MRSRFRIDLWLLAPVIILVIISLTTLLSINVVYFKSQLISLVVACLIFFFFTQVNYEFLKQLKVPIYIIAIILLSIILVLGIESHGAIRWIDIFGIRLQFSEILKPFLAFVFAAYLSETNKPKMKSFFAAILFLLPVVFLIDFQPDLGNAMIYIFAAIFVLVINGFPWWWFALPAIPVVLLSPLLWIRMHEYQRQRILTFLNPHVDPLGASYNGIQAVIAVGAGGFLGKGLSEGTQSGLRFLPERHTDFIFATISEGLGFIGATIIILSLLFLCYRIYVIFQRSDDLFIKLFAASAFAFILIQCFVNIGMNIGYMPIVGVTLPFVSFGGSSLLANFIFLGLLSNMSSRQRHKKVLEIK